MDIYDRRAQALKSFIGERPIKQVADQYQLSAAYLSNLINGHSRMGERTALKLEERLGVHGMFTSTLTVAANEPLTSQRATAPSVPVISPATLSDDLSLEKPDPSARTGVIRAYSEDPNAYAMQIIGDGLFPRLKHTEFILLEPGRPLDPGDEALVVTTEGKAYLCEFSYLRAGTYRFNSLLPSGLPLLLKKEEISYIHPYGAILQEHFYTPFR